MDSILKILSDTPCKIYCDFELKGEVVANSIFRLELRKGTYILEFVSIENDNYRISQEYIMQSNDEQDLLKIYFLEIIDAQKRENEFWKIAELPEEFINKEKIKEKYNLIINKTDTVGLLGVNIGGQWDDIMGWYIEGGKFGCVNKLGEIQIPIIYDNEIIFKNKNVTVAQLGEKKFLINKFGEIAFDNDYDEVEDFVTDYCVVGKDQSYGIIDSTGKIIIPIQYNAIKLLKHNQNHAIIWANLNEKWGVLDTNNNIISPFYYDEICINSTTISIRKNNLWGVSKHDGEIVTPVVYEFISKDDFKNETLVKRNNQFGVLNYNLKNLYLSSSDKKNPHEVVPCQYDAMYDDYGRDTDSYSNLFRLYFIKVNEDKTITCHRYDDIGNLICEFTCEKFNRNEVWRNEKCGIINAQGETIIHCEYDEIDSLSSGYSSIGYKVKKDNLWGFISKEGEVLSECLYDKIEDAGYYNEINLIFIIAIIGNKFRMLMQSPFDLLLSQVGDEYDKIQYRFDPNNHETKGFFAVKLGINWAIADLSNFKMISKFIYSGIYYYSEKEAEIMQIIDNRRLYGLFSLVENKESEECRYLQFHDDRNCNWVAVYDKSLKKEGIVIQKTNKVIVPFVNDYIRIYFGLKSNCFVIGKDIKYNSDSFYGVSNGKFAITNTKMELITDYIFKDIHHFVAKPTYLSLSLLNPKHNADIELNNEYIQYIAPLFEYYKYDDKTIIDSCPFKNLTLFIDVETTGLSLKGGESYDNLDNWSHIVQLGFILCDDNFGKLSERSIILKPEKYNIPIESTIIHGITHDFALNNGENRFDVLSYMDRILSNVDVVIGHNIEFDLNTLKCEILRAKGSKNILFENKNHKVIDTMKIGCDICRIPSYKSGEKYKWPTLDELYTKLFNKSFNGQHNAMNDIKATYECYFEMINNKTYNVSKIGSGSLPF